MTAGEVGGAKAAGAEADEAAGALPPEAQESWHRPGWMTIAAKEFADHLLSVRFVVLLFLLGLAALVPLYFAADRIRAAAPEASGGEAIFLFLFTLGSEQVPLLRVDAFIGIVAPLLGIAFAFDAVNGERAEGTLPRLLSQPIHRDDVINGKFVAGLAIISLVLVTVAAIIAGFGLFRLGIVPAPEEILRILAWLSPRSSSPSSTRRSESRGHRTRTSWRASGPRS